MVQRSYVVTTMLIASLLGCGSADSSGDGARPNCSGSQAESLTCNSSNARPILASRYDPARGCFEAFASPAGWCAVPTYCPGGGGTTACAVAPSGSAYLTYLLYGEVTTDPGWHFDDQFVGSSALINSEESLCEALWATLDVIVDADGGVADERALYATSTSVRATPTCD